jgi:NAD-dependent dihydropyrimidine dehydrogenase PreA subunit
MQRGASKARKRSGHGSGDRSGHGSGGRERPARPVARIDPARCDRSPGCPVSRVCPKEAVVLERAAATGHTPTSGSLSRSRPVWTVDERKCTGCLLCARYCPQQAVEPAVRQAS